MRSVIRQIWFAALMLALGVPQARGASDPSAPPVPLLRSVDSTALLSDSAGAELFLIHPWDNPQRYDTSRTGGPNSGLRPLGTDRSTERGAELKTETLSKESSFKPVGIDALKNYPNPFNAQTTIEFRLVTAGPVELSLYNLLGQAVRTVRFERLESGTHDWTWNGLLEGGRPAPSGIYFYRVSSGAYSVLEKMVLLK